jgi:predicted alpha-1,2-mannosidase
MKKLTAILVILLIISCAKKQQDLTGYVDPFIGTDAHGHTFPGATTPFGMIQLSPSNDFKAWDWCSGYHYSDSIIKGFAHNHVSGAGLSGLGDILVMPTRGKKTTNPGSEDDVENSYRSRFSHDEEEARAGYYKVTLQDYNIDVELTAGIRTGYHQYTFTKGGEIDVVIDAAHGVMEKVTECTIQIKSDTEIVGYKKTGNNPTARRMYFSAKFSKPFTMASITEDNKTVNAQEHTSATTRALATFTVNEGEKMLVTVTLSPNSLEGVAKNFEAEAKGKTFNDALENATQQWNKVLNKIVLSNNEPLAKKRTFYTAMYHAFISPNIISDVDGNYVVEGKQLHSNIPQYSNYSTWDTYRALHPLFTIIEQEKTKEFVNSMISRSTEANVGQPVWELIGYDNACMIGYTTVPVIGEAVLKGIEGIDAQQAFAVMRDAAFDLTKHSAVYDVSGLEDYINYGYVTAETGSSVSKTTEYNYHDYVIAQVANKIGDTENEALFTRRSKGYRALFDKTSGYFYPKLSTGEVKEMDLTAWDGLKPNYVSGNIWAYSAYTPQDMKGVIQLHGGKDKYAAWLDKVFSDTTQVGGEQHVDISGFIGKYGHGDEPGHQMPYLYNYVGQPYKTQKLVNEVVTTMYSDKPDGLINNEDLGQMSAWYIFSTLGFYPVAPASLEYQIGAPYYKEASINLENGNTFTVKAENLSETNIYVQSVTLNSKSYNKNYILHEDIMSGGNMVFTMGNTPNQEWGSKDEATSVGTLEAIMPKIDTLATFAPFDASNTSFFVNKHMVTLESKTPNTTIYYTLDGTEPTTNSTKYTGPFAITQNSTLKAMATSPNLTPSKVYSKPFFKSVFPNLPIGYPKYELTNSHTPWGKGDGSLLFDEQIGSTSYGDSKWTGIKDAIEITINLGKSQVVEGVSVGILNDQASWIFPAKGIEVYGGNSESNMLLIGKLDIQEPTEYTKEVNRHVVNVKQEHYQYLRIKIIPYGAQPAWHAGAGQQAWLFVDEVIVF